MKPEIVNYISKLHNKNNCISKSQIKAFFLRTVEKKIALSLSTQNFFLMLLEEKYSVLAHEKMDEEPQPRITNH